MNFFRCGGGGAAAEHDNVHIGDTEPTTPKKFTVWLDTSNSSNILKIFDGTNWIVVSGTWA